LSTKAVAGKCPMSDGTKHVKFSFKQIYMVLLSFYYIDLVVHLTLNPILNLTDSVKERKSEIKNAFTVAIMPFYLVFTLL